MPDEEWIYIDQVQGQLQAEILKGLFEAQGIKVWLNQEGVAHAYAIEIGSLGSVEILVPSSQAEKARQILAEYNRGDFENMEFQDPGPDETPEE
jgi:hypothetical protein